MHSLRSIKVCFSGWLAGRPKASQSALFFCPLHHKQQKGGPLLLIINLVFASHNPHFSSYFKVMPTIGKLSSRAFIWAQIFWKKTKNRGPKWPKTKNRLASHPLCTSYHHFSCLAEIGFWPFWTPIFGLFSKNLGSYESSWAELSNGVHNFKVAWKMGTVWQFEDLMVGGCCSLYWSSCQLTEKKLSFLWLWLSDWEACGLPASQHTKPKVLPGHLSYIAFTASVILGYTGVTPPSLFFRIKKLVIKIWENIMKNDLLNMIDLPMIFYIYNICHRTIKWMKW